MKNNIIESVFAGPRSDPHLALQQLLRMDKLLGEAPLLSGPLDGQHLPPRGPAYQYNRETDHSVR